MKAYWSWFKDETTKFAGLNGLLKDYLQQESRNAANAGKPIEIYTRQLRMQIDNWVNQGWLYEKPSGKEIKGSLLDLGMRLHQGKWIKG